MADRLKIIQGTDKRVVLRLKPKSGDPLDLTLATSIQFIFDAKDRTKITFANNVIPAQKAYAKYLSVTYTAVTASKNGNGILLVFNGTDSIEDVIDAWNAANGGNQVGSDAEDDQVVPAAGSVRLSGGYDTYSPVAILGSPLLGKIVLTILEKETNMLKSGPNQSFKVLVDFGENTGGDRAGGFFENKLDVINSSI